MSEQTLNNGRITAIDALRGFAVMGIMLLHNIEHFNFYSFPKVEHEWLRSLDSSIWDMMFFTFSGKATLFLLCCLDLLSICKVETVRNAG